MFNMETSVGLLLCFSVICRAQLQYSQEMSSGFVFSWDYDDSHITIQLTGPTLGWIGIGFSKTETMAESDLIIVGVQDEDPYAWDAYSPINGVVEIAVEQKLSIVNGVENDTHTTVTVKRPLKGTGKDNVIKEGVNNVIWAYGKADKLREEKLSDYHGDDRGHQKIILINKKSSPPNVHVTSYTTKPAVSTSAAANMAEERDEMDSDIKLPFSVPLDRNQTVHLRWNFDKEYITLQLIAPSTGWIGIGLSQTASMLGADLIIMGKVTEGLYALDAHAEKNGVPDLDETQNVEIIYGLENGTHTIMTVKRKRVTCDDDDMSIKEGTYRVIWAYGGSDLNTDVPTSSHYHGLNNRGAKSLKLINPVVTEEEREVPEKYFNIRASNFRVPPVDTYYLCRAIEIPNYMEKRHIIRISPYLQAGNEKNIHHIVIYLCNGELDPDIVGKHMTCFTEFQPFAVGCTKMLTGWAVGQSDFRFPKDVGFPLGGKNKRYVILQTHYDNPEMKEFEDSSGMRVYYTEKPRQNEAGSLTISNSIPFLWAPPDTKRYRADGHCSEICLSKGMETSGINEVTVVSTFLHAHLAGSGMRLHHYRKGKELNPLAKDDNYDFDYQELQYVDHGTVKIKKGDSMSIQCDYDTTGRTNITTGGLSTRNEMCVAFVVYYPELKLNLCDSGPNIFDPSALLQLTDGLNISLSFEEATDLLKRMQGTIGQNNAMDVLATVLNQVEWTDEKKKFAENFMNNLNRLPICLGSEGWLMNLTDYFPVPKYEEYVDEDECKEKAWEDSSTEDLRLSALVGASAILLIIFAAGISLRKS